MRTMPGIHQYHGTKLRYTPEILNQALEEIKSGKKFIKEAARNYNISRITLKKKLRETHPKTMEHQYKSPLEGAYDDGYQPRKREARKLLPYSREACSGSKGHRNTSQPSSSFNHPTTSTDTSSSQTLNDPEPSIRPKYSDRFKQPSYPRELTDMFGALECRLCAVMVHSPIVARMHYSGKQHMKKIKCFLENWSSRTGLPIPKIENPQISSQTSMEALENYCEICDVRMTSSSDKILHYSGKNHQKNVKDPENAKKKNKAYVTVDISPRFGIGSDFKTDVCETSEDIAKEFLCDLCDVKAVSQEQLEIHLSGKKHKERLEKQEKKIPRPVNPSVSILASVVKDQPRDIIDYSMHRTPSGKPYVCKMCNVGLQTEKLYELHLQGKKHAKALVKRDFNKTWSNVCKVCKVSFTSIEQYEDHINGKKHAKKRSLQLIGSQKVLDETSLVPCKYCTFVGNLDNHQCVPSLLDIDYKTKQSKYICFTCNMVFDSEEEYNNHGASQSHMLSVLNTGTGDKTVEGLEHWYCNLCKTQCRNNKEYTDHFFEEKHLSFTNSHSYLNSFTDLFKCEVCNLYLGEQTKNEHLIDPKHFKKAYIKSTTTFLNELAHEESATPNYECKQCNIILPTFVSYSEHLLHDTHMEKVISKMSQNE